MSLCDAIAAWEDRVETSKPEDLPNHVFIGNAFEERQPGIWLCTVPFWCAVSLCVILGVFPFVCLTDTENW
jgi:hypothetical protein